MARKFRPSVTRRGRPQPVPTIDAAPSTDPVPPAIEPPVRRGRGQRLTINDRYRLLETHKLHQDWSYHQLADACGVSVETARLSVLAAGKSAADLMAAHASPMLRQWSIAAKMAAIRGDHRPAKDWLLHAGVLDQLPDAGRGSGPAVVIINAPLPGMPANEIRVIEGASCETGRIEDASDVPPVRET